MASSISLSLSHTCNVAAVALSPPLPKSVSSPSLNQCRPFCGLRKASALHGVSGLPTLRSKVGRGKSRVVCAFGDVSPDATIYLIVGAVAIAIVGTAYPLLFSRKDLCPQCDGAGFVRKSGAALAANAARKDQEQIVCPRCKGLGKLGQIDK